MRFLQLEYVLAVAECKSFSKAAQKLFISQPSLSQYIMGLEKEFGVQFFDRSVSPIRLTYAGEIFADYAQRILMLKKQLEDTLLDETTQQGGKLSVGFSPFRSSCLLPYVMPLFQQRFPEIKVEFAIQLLDQLATRAGDGLLDLFLTVRPIPREQEFCCEHLVQERVVLAVPPNHPINEELTEYCVPEQYFIDSSQRRLLDSFKTVPLSRFAALPFVLLGSGQNLHKLSLQLCSRAGFDPDIRLTNSSLESITSLVISGMGATFVPDTYIKFSNLRTHPKYYLLDDPTAQRELVAAYKKNRKLSVAGQAFVHILKDSLQ
jgi:DNA-binding transcriptional LysR family regulator